jgi:hypothetical protein
MTGVSPRQTRRDADLQQAAPATQPHAGADSATVPQPWIAERARGPFSRSVAGLGADLPGLSQERPAGRRYALAWIGCRSQRQPGGRTRRLAVAAGCQAPRPGPDGGPVDEDRRMAVIRFRAQLRAAARPPRSRPATPSGGRGRRRHTIPVVATVNGDTWQTSVARIGGVFLAGLNREVRGGAGGQAGDGAEVTIGLDGRRARSRCPRFWRRPSPLTRDRLHPSSRRPSPTASSTPAGSLKPGQNNPATARGPGPGDDPGRKGPLLPSPPPRLLSLSYRFAPGRGSPLAPNDHSGVARLDRDHIPPAVR